MTVADALVRSLRRLGVQHVFGLPGSTEGPLLDALEAPGGPEYILGLHENVVAAMADGYARASGRLGVVSLHTSVGTGNAVSQILNASVDRSPVLALIGHKDARLNNRDGFCTVEDLPGVLRPFAKWSREVTDAAQAVEDLERAARLAVTTPRGPVALVVTEDKARAPWPDGDDGAPVATPGPGTSLEGAVGRYRPSREGVQAAARMLSAAQRPVIIAGDGVAWTDAADLLGEVARAYGCAVLQEPRRSAARMNCSTDDPSYCGEYSAQHPAAEAADLVLAVGARIFVEFEPMPSSELPAGAAFIHIHEDATELGKRYVPDLALVATAREALADLLEAAGAASSRRSEPPEWVEELRTRFVGRRETAEPALEPDQPLTVAAASRVLDAELPADVILFDEGVRSSRVLMQHFSVPADRAYHRNTGGAIGWGLPAAIGAQLACPDRPVALFVGDGSALLTIQALWTAARYQVPVTVFIANNRGYQAVQAAVVKHRSGARLAGAAVGAAIDEPAPDFVRLAEGFGVGAVSVRTADQLRRAVTGISRTSGGRGPGRAVPTVIELVLSEEEVVGSGGPIPG